MRLLQTSYNDKLENTVKQWTESLSANERAALFHIYVPYDLADNRVKTDAVRGILRTAAPDIPVIGCSATGEILEGSMNDTEIVLSLMIFDKPGTGIEVLPYYDKKMDETALLKYAAAIPNLKGIEVLTASSYQDMDGVAMLLDELPEEVELFGGVAVGDAACKSFVFADDCDYSENGTVFVFYSGEDFHIQTNRMFGWKAIGYPLTVTRSEGPVVYELDGKPAYDVYHHYLHIGKGKNFFYDALEFPWEVQIDETTNYIRHAKSLNPDGSIVMSSNIPQGSRVRLTYGDPRRIFEHTKQTGLLVRDFAPQVVNIFNCMGRKLFWGGNEDVEIAEISKHMQTTGFSALGEIMRYKSQTVLNNLSIVCVAMREGKAQGLIDLDVEQLEKSSDMPITARLAIFINTITEELMEKNEQLNEMLYKASHDALTGLLNRGAIERIIYDAENEDWYLIMLDVDDFKQINDRYGHNMGDKILKLTTRHLYEHSDSFPGIQAGRWGGEEFMLFVSGYSPEQVKDIAERLRKRVKACPDLEVNVTISVGVTAHHAGESVLETIDKVDALMYRAKEQGKDRVCSDI